MRQYHVDNSSGCLVLALIALIFISLATAMGRFFFTTPVGLVLFGLIVIRHFWIKSLRKKQEENYNRQTFKEKQKQQEEEFKQRDDIINPEDVVDVDYVEIVDLDKE